LKSLNLWAGSSLCIVALVIKLEGELNESRVVTSRGDAAEVTGLDDLSGVRIDAAPGCSNSVGVADQIGEVHVIEDIEKLGAEFDIL